MSHITPYVALFITIFRVICHVDDTQHPLSAAGRGRAGGNGGHGGGATESPGTAPGPGRAGPCGGQPVPVGVGAGAGAMHSLAQEIRSFSRAKLRQQRTRVTTLTGRRLVETWRGACLQVAEEEEALPGGGFVRDLSCDLQVGAVRPWLLLGSQDAAHDLETLSKHKVTHILNVAYGVQNAFVNDFIYKTIPILDIPETDITSYFPECFEFIEKAKNQLEIKEDNLAPACFVSHNVLSSHVSFISYVIHIVT
uniref:Dual specificity phosphatase 19 n=1 Tax=Anas zonorhyncha TaxID=75864 RepID=A0A8B9ZX51_9AVES